MRLAKPTGFGVHLGLAVALWLGVAGVGFFALLAHAHRPGEVASPAQLDALEGVAKSEPGVWHVVMGVNPNCPCSHASVAQLAHLERRFRERLRAVVLTTHGGRVLDPQEATRSASWLHEHPALRVVDDAQGTACRAAGIKTSGAVVLYDPAGRPRFWGGITPSRGHVGPCTGLEAAAALVEGRLPPATTAPAYGCALATPAEGGTL